MHHEGNGRFHRSVCGRRWSGVILAQIHAMSQKPHAILYVFQVIKGQEAAFEAAWADVTREIHANCGSLGSRLHTWVGGTYWAYAQWPSREALENAEIEGHATLMEARKRMVEACESMEVFGEGNIVHDLFVKESA